MRSLVEVYGSVIELPASFAGLRSAPSGSQVNWRVDTAPPSGVPDSSYVPHVTDPSTGVTIAERAIAGDDLAVRYSNLAFTIRRDAGGRANGPSSEPSHGTISVHEAGLPFDATIHHLMDHIVPFAIASSGSVVLHAAATAHAGSAVAFVGVSGTGKSTTATVLARNGWSLLTDDAVAIKRDSDNRPIAQLGHAYVRLSANSKARALEEGRTVGADSGDKGKSGAADNSVKQAVFADEAGATIAIAPSALEAIVELSVGDGTNDGPAVPQQVGPAEATHIIMRHSFRLDPYAPSDNVAFMKRCAELAGTIPVYRWSRPNSIADLVTAAPQLRTLAASSSGR